jgi:hypothetical protein
VILEAFGSVLLGFGLTWAVYQRLSHRLPSRRLVFGVGPFGGLLGAYVTHMALGPGHVLAAVVGGVTVSAVVLSLLTRPSGRRIHGPMPS